MNNELENFQKQNDYLLCIDSDGCAMDAMEIKHRDCFGPCMIREWNLYPWEDRILERWNQINLYSMTRGINRFRGLAMALEEINESITPIEDTATLSAWAAEAPELSNQALKNMLAFHPSPSLEKALNWSIAVNNAIAALKPEAVMPFEHVKESLQAAYGQPDHRKADMAMVSSANRDAVTEEWTRYGLIESLDLILAQDNGSKADCISALLAKGYQPSHVLMVGDAPGDLEAARRNKVLFFPILAGHEADSWRRFGSEILPSFLEGRYEAMEDKEIQSFLHNLKA